MTPLSPGEGMIWSDRGTLQPKSHSNVASNSCLLSIAKYRQQPLTVKTQRQGRSSLCHIRIRPNLNLKPRSQSSQIAGGGTPLKNPGFAMSLTRRVAKAWIINDRTKFQSLKQTSFSSLKESHPRYQEIHLSNHTGLETSCWTKQTVPTKTLEGTPSDFTHLEVHRTVKSKVLTGVPENTENQTTLKQFDPRQCSKTCR